MNRAAGLARFNRQAARRKRDRESFWGSTPCSGRRFARPLKLTVRLTNQRRETRIMKTSNPTTEGQLVHVVTLECKDEEHAARCLAALTSHGRPDALSFKCVSYEFGLKEGSSDTVYIVERWTRWEDLDALLGAKVVPALPMYNQLLKRPFDPSKDTLRIRLSTS